ncbi:hypothetical protein Cgig2_012339 [Carnegiea gigantea]|uniref:Uncharacterized protein n=1 Tax=Carnegiea gigantea TaxID=171969 RepID=A0A9Q1Q5I8_9CARY|nr:hypothetical protein Cgig2_012339 [Carnegiea gigantea]
MKAANSARPLPHFDYVPTNGGEPSHRPERVPSPHYTEWGREFSRSNRNGWHYTEQQGRRAAARPSGRPTQGPTQGSDRSIFKERTPVPSTRTGAHTTPTARLGVFDRSRGHNCQGLCGRNDPVSLESSAQKYTAGTYHSKVHSRYLPLSKDPT